MKPGDRIINKENGAQGICVYDKIRRIGVRLSEWSYSSETDYHHFRYGPLNYANDFLLHRNNWIVICEYNNIFKEML